MEMSKGTGPASHDTVAGQAFELLDLGFTVNGLQFSTNRMQRMNSTVFPILYHSASNGNGHNSEKCPSDSLVQLRLRLYLLGNG
jgi:hypothetical protein